MSGTIIKTKYSSTTVAPIDGSLAVGEMAYSFMSDKLFIGDDSASSVSEIIGGKYFTDKLDHNLGTLTKNSAILVDASKKIDVLNVDNITLDSNTVSTTNANGNLILNPNGTGQVQVQASTLAVVGNFTVSGTTVVTLGSTLGNLKTAGNTTSAINTDGDIVLRPNGTGKVTIDTNTVLVIPKGLESTRPTPTAATNGAMRYNETTNRFEGVVSGNWTGVGGVVDVDQDTYISAETTLAGSPTDDDTLRFYAKGNEEVRVDDSGMYITAQITSPIANITTANISTSNVTNKLYVTASDVTYTGGIDVTSGNVDIADTLNVGNDLNVTGNTIISGNLTVDGTTTSVNSTVTTLNDPVIKVGDGSTVAGDGLDRGVNFDYGDGSTVKTGFFGYDTQTSRFSFKPDTSVSSENYSAPWGDVQFNNVYLSGDIEAVNTTLSGTLDVTDATTLNNTLNVVNSTTLSDTLDVTKSTTLYDTLDVTDATTLNNTLNVVNSTTLSDTLDVTKATTLNDTLEVTKSTILSDTLDVTKATTLSDTLDVTKATTLNDTLEVTNATTLYSTLSVDGHTEFFSSTHLGNSAQMQINDAGVMTHGTIDGVNVVIDCGTF
jgi:hypothetical protein